MSRPLYSSRTYSQTEVESLVALVVMLAAAIATLHWLYGSHPFWFWVVTATLCVLVPVEVRRYRKETRLYQEWWEQLTRDW